MGDWLRSAEMEYVSLIINEDVAHNCVQRLARLGSVQFTDLNSELTPFQRRYVSYIKRCDELERRLRYFDGELGKFGIKPVETPGGAQQFVHAHAQRQSSLGQTPGAMLESLEAQFEAKEAELLELNSIHENLQRELNEKCELTEVLQKARTFYESEVPRLEEEDRQQAEARAAGRARRAGSHDGRAPLLSPGASDYGSAREAQELKFTHLTGVVALEDRERFERMLFRATRGNCFVRFEDIDEPIMDPHTGTAMIKCVFIIFYKSRAIEQKISKICDAFHASRYTVPDLANHEEVSALMAQTAIEVEESRRIVNKNREAAVQMCRGIAQHLEAWQFTVLQEKATYHTMNSLRPDVSGMLRGEGWVIAEDMDKVRAAVQDAHKAIGVDSLLNHVPRPWPEPPTHFPENAFTAPYQEIVDTYGIAAYREINPALFSAATFPFLYGVMYGDIGHGSCLLLFGIYLCASKNDGSALDGLRNARYLLTLMGACAVYCGLIYNDYFSLGLNLFGSTYEFAEGSDGEVAGGTEANWTGDVYPFGADPVWHLADNQLLFMNSLKMKLSVILGITHMMVGVFISGANSIYFGKKLDLVTEFPAKLAFAGALFVYMQYLIVYKWSVDWDERMLMGTCTQEVLDGGEWPDECGAAADIGQPMTCRLNYGANGDAGGCQPPGLINQLIGIMLSPGSVTDPAYDGQASTQLILLAIAGIAMPVLLLAKPLILKSQAAAGTIDHIYLHGHDHFDFGEIMIHSTIETIEFILGMVSNTASYLRLWALSLAHTELAEVFFEKGLLIGLNSNNAVMIFCLYAGFAGVSFGVLLCMDVLECFLHTLRLHWVEFMNKFYAGTGYKFNPLSFVNLIKASKQKD